MSAPQPPQQPGPPGFPPPQAAPPPPGYPTQQSYPAQQSFPAQQGYPAQQGFPQAPGHPQWTYPQQPAQPGFPPPGGHPQRPGRPASNGPRIAFAVVLCVFGIFFAEEGVVSIVQSIAAMGVLEGRTQTGLNNTLSVLRGAVLVLAGATALTTAILYFTRTAAARILAVIAGGVAVLGFPLHIVFELHSAATSSLAADIADPRFMIPAVLGALIAGLAFVPPINATLRGGGPAPRPYPYR